MPRRHFIIATLLICLIATTVAFPVAAQEPIVKATSAAVGRASAIDKGISIGLPIYKSSDTGIDPAPSTRTIKIEGTVKEVYDELPGLIVVSGQAISVTEATIIRPSDAEIETGDYAIVHAVVEGELKIATNIRVYKSGPLGKAIEFRGMISEHPPEPYLGSWTVAGHTVIVTDVRAPKGDVPDLGYFAHVVGSVQDDETILADSVDVLRPDEVAGRFEFEGEIEEMGDVPGDWTIGGVTAWAEADTEVSGNVAVGAMAQVLGHQTAAGSLVFDKIIVPDSAVAPIVICGLIQEINVEEDGYGWWQVDGQIIEVDAQTFIDESQCRAAVGMWAQVVALPSGFSPYALRIRVERPE